MSSLYPSLEDMQVHKIVIAQDQIIREQSSRADNPPYNPVMYPQLAYSNQSSAAIPASSDSNALYPELGDFMGLSLNDANISQFVTKPSPTHGMIAPLSGSSVGLQRSHVTNGIRELILCKGVDGKVGLRVKDINNGIFVTVVVKDSPAALTGLRFGDQILQINGKIVAGYSKDAIHKLLKKSPKNDISIVVRDRPFERNVTLHKDSNGRVGFQFNNGKITTIVKDSSAAKNGLLIDHQILEVNGQNVVGMKDKEINSIISKPNESVITLTIIPSFIYDHMMKKMSSSYIRGIMDHSTPADF